MRWVIDTPSWPVTSRDDELTTKQILDVLDRVGKTTADSGETADGEVASC